MTENMTNKEMNKSFQVKKIIIIVNEKRNKLVFLFSLKLRTHNQLISCQIFY